MTVKQPARNLANSFLAAAVIAGAIAPAALADTQPTYDRRIEEAAIRMLQPKLGEIRGTLGLNPEGYLFPPLSQRMAENNDAFSLVPVTRGSATGSIIRY